MPLRIEQKKRVQTPTSCVGSGGLPRGKKHRKPKWTPKRENHLHIPSRAGMVRYIKNIKTTTCQAQLTGALPSTIRPMSSNLTNDQSASPSGNSSEETPVSASTLLAGAAVLTSTLVLLRYVIKAGLRLMARRATVVGDSSRLRSVRSPTTEPCDGCICTDASNASSCRVCDLSADR